MRTDEGGSVAAAGKGVAGQALATFAIIIGIACLFLSPLFFASRLSGLFFSWGIERLYYAITHEKIRFRIRSIRIALLGGKIIIQEFHYITENIAVHCSYCVVTLRWWRRSVRQGNQEGDSQPCRLDVAVEGLEYLIFNNTEYYHRLVESLSRRQGVADVAPREALEASWKSVLISLIQRVLPKRMTRALFRSASRAEDVEGDLPLPAPETSPDTTQDQQQPQEAATTTVLPSFFDIVPALSLRLVAVAVMVGNADMEKMVVLNLARGNGLYYSEATTHNTRFLYDFRFQSPRVYVAPNATAAVVRPWRARLDQDREVKEKFASAVASDEEEEEGEGDAAPTGGFLRATINRTLALFRLYYRGMEFEFVGPGMDATGDMMSGDGSPRPAGIDDAALADELLSADRLSCCYYSDDPGTVEAGEDPETSPGWGLDLKLAGGAKVRYGPAFDRIRDKIMSVFLPADYNDWELVQPVPGEPRRFLFFNVAVKFTDGAEVRIPFQKPSGLEWVSLDCGAGSEVSVRIPWEAVKPTGTVKRVVAHLQDVAVRTSVIADEKPMIASPTLLVDCFLGTPLVWNDRQPWDINIVFSKPNVSLLREHIDHMTDLVADWMVYETLPTFETFVPALYTYRIFMEDFTLSFNVSDQNVLGPDPQDRDVHAFIDLIGPHLSLDVRVPADKFQPANQTLPINLDVRDLTIAVSEPLHLAPLPYLCKSTFARISDLGMNMQYRYFYDLDPKPGECDSITMQLDVAEFRAKIYGCVSVWHAMTGARHYIRRVLGLLANYFGEHKAHCASFAERTSFVPTRREREVERPFELYLAAKMAPCELVMPFTMHPDAPEALCAVDWIGLELRNTDTFMDVHVSTSKIMIKDLPEPPSASPDGDGVFSRYHILERSFMSVESSTVQIFQLYGAPPDYSTYQTTYRVVCGDVHGQILPFHLLGLANWFADFKMWRDLPELPYSYDPLLDRVHLQLGAVSLGLWTADGVTEISVDSNLLMETDTLINENYHAKLCVSIPDLRVRHLRPTRRKRNQTFTGNWTEVWRATTALNLSVIDREPMWWADAELQREFLDSTAGGKIDVDGLQPLAMYSSAYDDVTYDDGASDEVKARRHMVWYNPGSVEEFGIPFTPSMRGFESTMSDPSLRSLDSEMSDEEGEEGDSEDDVPRRKISVSSSDIDSRSRGSSPSLRASHIVRRSALRPDPMRASIAVTHGLSAPRPSVSQSMFRQFSIDSRSFAIKEHKPHITFEDPRASSVAEDEGEQGAGDGTRPETIYVVDFVDPVDVFGSPEAAVAMATLAQDVTTASDALPALIDMPPGRPDEAPPPPPDLPARVAFRLPALRVMVMQMSQHHHDSPRPSNEYATALALDSLLVFALTSPNKEKKGTSDLVSCSLTAANLQLAVTLLKTSMRGEANQRTRGCVPVIAVDAQGRPMDQPVLAAAGATHIRAIYHGEATEPASSASALGSRVSDVVLMIGSNAPTMLKAVRDGWEPQITEVTRIMASQPSPEKDPSAPFNGSVGLDSVSFHAFSADLTRRAASVALRRVRVAQRSNREEECSRPSVRIGSVDVTVLPDAIPTMTMLADSFGTQQTSTPAQPKPGSGATTHTTLLVGRVRISALSSASGMPLMPTQPDPTFVAAEIGEAAVSLVSSGPSVSGFGTVSRLSLELRTKERRLVRLNMPLILCSVATAASPDKGDLICAHLNVGGPTFTVPHPAMDRIGEVAAFVEDWQAHLPHDLRPTAAPSPKPSSLMRVELALKDAEIRVQVLKSAWAYYLLASGLVEAEIGDRSSDQRRVGAAVRIRSHELVFVAPPGATSTARQESDPSAPPPPPPPPVAGAVSGDGIALPAVAAVLVETPSDGGCRRRVLLGLERVHSIVTDKMLSGLLALGTALQGDVDEAVTTGLDYVEGRRQFPMSSSATGSSGRSSPAIESFVPRHSETVSAAAAAAVAMSSGSPAEKMDMLAVARMEGLLVTVESGVCVAHASTGTVDVALAQTEDASRFVVSAKKVFALVAPFIDPNKEDGYAAQSDVTKISGGLLVSSLPPKGAHGMAIPKHLYRPPLSLTVNPNTTELWVMLSSCHVTVRPSVWNMTLGLMDVYKQALDEASTPPATTAQQKPIPALRTSTSVPSGLLPPRTPAKMLRDKVQKESRARMHRSARQAKVIDVAFVVLTRDLCITFPIAPLNPAVGGGVKRVEEACQLNLETLGVRADRLSEERKIVGGAMHVRAGLNGLSLRVPADEDSALATASISRATLRVLAAKQRPVFVRALLASPRVEFTAASSSLLTALFRDWESGVAAKAVQFSRAAEARISVNSMDDDAPETDASSHGLDVVLKVSPMTVVMRSPATPESRRAKRMSEGGTGCGFDAGPPLVIPAVTLRLQQRPTPLEATGPHLSSPATVAHVLVGDAGDAGGEEEEEDNDIVITPGMITFMSTFLEPFQDTAPVAPARPPTPSDEAEACGDDRMVVTVDAVQPLVVRFQDTRTRRTGSIGHQLFGSVELSDVHLSLASASRYNKYNPEVRLSMPTMFAMSMGRVVVRVRSPFFDYDSAYASVSDVLFATTLELRGARPSTVTTGVGTIGGVDVHLAYDALSPITDLAKVFVAAQWPQTPTKEPSTSSPHSFFYGTVDQARAHITSMPNIGQAEVLVDAATFRNADVLWLAKGSGDAVVQSVGVRRWEIRCDPPAPGLLDALVSFGGHDSDASDLTMLYVRRRAGLVPPSEWVFCTPPGLASIEFRKFPVIRLETRDISCWVRDLSINAYLISLADSVAASEPPPPPPEGGWVPVVDATLIVGKVVVSLTTATVATILDLSRYVSDVAGGFSDGMGVVFKRPESDTDVFLRKGAAGYHRQSTGTGPLGRWESSGDSAEGVAAVVDPTWLAESSVPAGRVWVRGTDLSIALFDAGMRSDRCTYDHVSEYEIVFREHRDVHQTADGVEAFTDLRCLDGTHIANAAILRLDKLGPFGPVSQSFEERLARAQRDEVLGLPYLGILMSTEQVVGSTSVLCDWESDFGRRPLRVKTVLALLNSVKNVHTQMGAGGTAEGGPVDPRIYEKRNPSVPYAFPELPLKCVGEKVTLGQLLESFGVLSVEELVVATHTVVSDSLASVLLAIHEIIMASRH